MPVAGTLVFTTTDAPKVITARTGPRTRFRAKLATSLRSLNSRKDQNVRLVTLESTVTVLVRRILSQRKTVPEGMCVVAPLRLHNLLMELLVMNVRLGIIVPTVSSCIIAFALYNPFGTLF